MHFTHSLPFKLINGVPHDSSNYYFLFVGKTTLMRSIANGSVEGFPDPTTVRTVFVEADIMGELSHLSCLEYIMQDPRYIAVAANIFCT